MAFLFPRENILFEQVGFALDFYPIIIERNCIHVVRVYFAVEDRLILVMRVSLLRNVKASELSDITCVYLLLM